MHRNRKCILLVLLIALLVTAVGCRNRNATTEETNGDTVAGAMEAHTTVEIVEVAGDAEAEVKITTPDLAAIYADIMAKNPDADMSAEDIAKAVAEYASDESYLITNSVVTSVEKDGNDWKLASDECIDEAVRSQVNNLMIQMINGIGTIEVDDISEDLE